MPRLLSSALGCCASLALATASLGQQKPVPQKLDAAAFAARVDGHWAWHPLRTAEPPRPGHPVDAFVEARLQAAGLARSAPAAPDVQLRREPFWQTSCASALTNYPTIYLSRRWLA